MPQTLDMACTALKHALRSSDACKRYTIMHDAKYQHPGWVDYQNKRYSSACQRLRTNIK